MKVLVLNGSPKPRAKSDTMCLTEAFLKGMNAAGEHEIDIVDVIKHDIKPCIGCFECWKKKNGKCVIDDYQNVILQKMIEADCIIWSFPLYCCGMPGHLKTVMDRMIPLSVIKSKAGEDNVSYSHTADFSKKRNVVICGSGFPLGVANFKALKIQCIHMFGRVRIICVNETPLMHTPGAEGYTDKLKAKFVAAGTELASTGFIRKETLDGLETPMMSNDEYLQLASTRA